MRRDAGRIAGWVMAAFVPAMLATVTAHAAGRHESWRRVEDLAAGKLIVVESNGQVAEECRVISADNASLTCVRDPDPDVNWGPGDDARVVFPRTAVQSVWVWQDVSDRRVLIRMGIGFAIGALICSRLGPAAAFICAGIGASIAALAPAMAESAPRYPFPGLPTPSYPVRPPDLRRELVYRAPVALPAPNSVTP